MGPCFRRDDARRDGRQRNKSLLSAIMDSMARMAQPVLGRLTSLTRGISARQIRLACGVVMFAYLTSHFLNHALGNVSIDALATGLQYHVMFWQFLPVAITFYTAALVHAGLGISAF